jgi:alkanesulfonate monooxygenase SsuD/methylene tetrahydromethanopterin reductase-like flavin-dependent oxidoreductase (luciferase family)
LNLGRLAITLPVPFFDARESVELGRRAEREWGYEALWLAETNGPDSFSLAGALAVGTERVTPVPIYLAALRGRMCALAGEIGDGLVVNPFSCSALPRMLAAYREGARRAGRNASRDEVVCRFQVAVTDDVAGARALFRMVFSAYFATPVYNAYLAWCGLEDEARRLADAFARGDRAGTAAALADEVVDRIAILGSAGKCREKIAEFVAAGVTTPVISPLAGSARSVEAVFEAFAPALHPKT